MSKLEHQAEILKLARFLDVERDALGMLESVAAADIRRLREPAAALKASSNLQHEPPIAIIEQGLLHPRALSVGDGLM
ncbi:hypothetical protein, partial [Algiphilus sp.]|uniref:hypothetical protein n=1 Tax=Algiphilus sp. TaxID=1872431 RepID=UPI003C691925